MSVKDVKAQELIEKIATRLEKMEELKPPEWAGFVKTGVSRERSPSQQNWWWIRAGSVLRKVYLNHKIGVSKLRKVYGGRKNRGHKPEHKYKASGAVIRKVLQQLEAAGLVKTEIGKNKKPAGRVITPKGMSLLSAVAKSIK